jgi:hypothetical protein
MSTPPAKSDHEARFTGVWTLVRQPEAGVQAVLSLLVSAVSGALMIPNAKRPLCWSYVGVFPLVADWLDANQELELEHCDERLYLVS